LAALLIAGADEAAFFVVQNRKIDRAGDVACGELRFGSHVD
jgi:hypothetical protein